MLIIGDNIVNGTLVTISVEDDGTTTVLFPNWKNEPGIPLSVTFSPVVTLGVVSNLVLAIVNAGNPYQ